MIKTVLRYVEKELKAGEEYIEVACIKKHHDMTTAELFISLAGEELGHAERLLKQGQVLADKIHPNKESPEYEHDIKCLAIWEWEKEKALEEIAELRADIHGFNH